MQFTTSEKDTISLNKLYFSNYTILTSGFNVIFDGKIPDGVIINNDLMLIIESKKYIRQDEKQLFQIKGYISSGYKNISLIKQIYPSVKIIIGVMTNGTTINDYNVVFVIFNPETQYLKLKSKIQHFSNIGFDNSKQEINVNQTCWTNKTIHNNLVKLFKFTQPKDLTCIMNIILISFNDHQCVELYKSLNSFDNKYFKPLILKACQELLPNKGDDYKMYLSTIETLDDSCNMFYVCKNIYQSFIKSPDLVSALTEQFKTYWADESLKNQVWTPYYVCDLMYGLMKQYTSSEFNLLDPCIGGNNLIKPFISNSNLKHVYGCEYEKIMYQYSSIDLILNKIDSTIYYEDFNVKYRSFDGIPNLICVCNPPYTKNTSKYQAIEFVINAMKVCKSGIFILPLSQLSNPSYANYKKELLSITNVSKIINLGKNVFRKMSTGDICLLICDKTYSNNTKYVIAKNYSEGKSIVKVPRNQTYNFSQEHNKIVSDLLNNTSESVKIIEFTTNNNWCFETNSLQTKLLAHMHSKINKILMSQEELNYIKYFNLTETKPKELDKLDNLSEKELLCVMYEISYNSTISSLKLVKFSDYFIEVKKTHNYNYKTTDENTGNVPLYGCKKYDNGIAGYVSKPEYEQTDGVLVIVKSRDATCGYTNVCYTNLAWNSFCLVYRPINSNTNLTICARLLTLQLSPNHIDADRFTSSELNDRFVYLNVE